MGEEDAFLWTVLQGVACLAVIKNSYLKCITMRRRASEERGKAETERGRRNERTKSRRHAKLRQSQQRKSRKMRARRGGREQDQGAANRHWQRE